jgi:hypothetical protein
MPRKRPPGWPACFPSRRGDRRRRIGSASARDRGCVTRWSVAACNGRRLRGVAGSPCHHAR